MRTQETAKAVMQARLAADHAAGVAPSHPETCGWCGHEADRSLLKLCQGCRSTRYCGAACQRAAWPSHKAACRELKGKGKGQVDGAGLMITNMSGGTQRISSVFRFKHLNKSGLAEGDDQRYGRPKGGSTDPTRMRAG